MDLKDPGPALTGSAAPEERRRPQAHTTSGYGNGPAGKKKIGMDSEMDG
jgi:hypothetical protein